MEFLEFLPALNELAVGAVAILVLAWLYKNTLDSFQEQNALHNEQINKMVQALAKNNDKLGDLVDIVKDGVRKDEDIQRELRDQKDKIDNIKDTVDEIKKDVQKRD